MAVATGTPVQGATGTKNAAITDFGPPWTGAVMGAAANPQRLYLLVLFSTATGRVCPAPASTVYGLGPDVAGAPGGRLIHRASFPGAIDGEWFVYDSGGGSIRVIDVEDDPPG